LVARVFPGNALDRFLFYNMSAEVWLEPHRPPTQGRIYRHKAEGRFGDGAVALVLGAGNVSSIGPLDLVYKLFVEDQVVLLKMHPVNEYLAPLFERAFSPLIKHGFLQIVTGGADVGAYLCAHPQIDTLHLTGAAHTYDAIVWGADAAERDSRKARGEPLVDKPFTAELGCVTPVLVVPGRWSNTDIEFQARHVAAMVAHNASFNCTAGKVLVTASGWDRREAFLDAVERALAAAAPRYAYYPGAEARYAAFLERYPQARVVGAVGDGVVPWTLIRDLRPRPGEYALNHEAFCGVLAEVPLAAAGAPEFLAQATAFANDELWGTLSCNVIADEATLRDEAGAVERAVAGLRYGCIGVNAWSGVGFALGVTTWGAFPGHTPDAIGSGVGVVHNAFLFDHPQKSVVRAPFRIWPTPVWFADHRNLLALGRRMTRYEARSSPWLLPGVALAGARG
jgi:acyl-CoA reductase-like NAD-dependent aldehyde dehydrogenase